MCQDEITPIISKLRTRPVRCKTYLQPDPDFLNKHHLADKKQLVALLPGSRKSELVKIIPLMVKVIDANPDYNFVVAAVKSMPEILYEPISKYSNVHLVFDATYDLLSHAHAAIVTSGTATLETGLFKVPQVVVYKANRLEFFLAKWMIKVEFVSLVNLIVGKEAIRELIQKEATIQNTIIELRRLVEDSFHRDKIMKDYDQLLKILDTGSASTNAARLMVNYLRSED